MNTEELLKVDKVRIMVAIWILAGGLYLAYMAITGDKGYTGVLGLVMFILVVLVSPRLAEELEKPLRERLS